MMLRDLPFPLAGLALLFMAWPGWVVAGGHLYHLDTRVGQTSVAMFVPEGVHVGLTAPLRVRVAPDEDAETPRVVRVRVGMPEHGHWVSEEAFGRANGESIRHDTDLPMPGLYRLRVWLDYPDGTTLRTGADFYVGAESARAPRLAP
jgi:hypothetical protein